MKRIVLAIDSFKGCLSSAELAEEIVRHGAIRYPDTEFRTVSVSDGGEGLLEAIAPTRPTREIVLNVHDPLMRNLEARYLTADHGNTAILEMACAAGLPLLAPRERNPLATTTFGVGELIADALDRGCRHFLMGIGGSATNDAGTGMMQALGFRLLDSRGNELAGTGASLERIASINRQNVRPSLKEATFEIACDVNNPFYGTNGAAYVFAPQKGADLPMVERLDRGLRNFANVLHAFSGKRIDTVAGAGAAGGLGGCLMALFGAKLCPGIQLLLDTVGFDRLTGDASLIITGEGRMDGQTLLGKVAYGVLQRGKRMGIPVIALAGRIDDRESLLAAGFDGLFEVSPREIPLSRAMEKETALRNLRRTLQQPGVARYFES